jgi:hypothetical protein
MIKLVLSLRSFQRREAMNDTERAKPAVWTEEKPEICEACGEQEVSVRNVAGTEIEVKLCKGCFEEYQKVWDKPGDILGYIRWRQGDSPQ